MALPYLLLAAQAAGIGMNLYAQRRAEKFTRIGEELEKQQLQLRMSEEQLAYTQKSLYGVEQLREVLASQRAIMAARGQAPGLGSAKALETRSVNVFNADERARQLSQTFRKNQLDSQMSLYNINRSTRKAQRKMNSVMQGLNMFSFNALGENPFGGNNG